MSRILLAVVSAITLFMVAHPGAHAAADPLEEYVYKKCLHEFNDGRMSREQLHALASKKAAHYTAMIRAAAERNDVPATIVTALIWYESNYREDARSHAGALGLCQVMPFHFRPHGYAVQTWRNPRVNIDISTKLLKGFFRRMRSRFPLLPDDVLWERALVCYNMGEGGVSRGIYRSRYSRAILTDHRTLSGRQIIPSMKH